MIQPGRMPLKETYTAELFKTFDFCFRPVSKEPPGCPHHLGIQGPFASLTQQLPRDHGKPKLFQATRRFSGANMCELIIRNKSFQPCTFAKAAPACKC